MTDANQYQADADAHPGGVVSAFGDGAMRFISNSVDVSVWRALCSSNGNDPADPRATDGPKTFRRSRQRHLAVLLPALAGCGGTRYPPRPRSAG